MSSKPWSKKIPTILTSVNFLFLLVASLFWSCPKGESPDAATNTPPVAVFAISADKTTTGTSVDFTDASTDKENDIVSWKWDFGDGSSIETIQNVKHVFSKAGSFLVTLTVEDRLGKRSRAIKRILVNNISPPDYGRQGGLRELIEKLYPKVMVCAHRALKDRFPENSVEAIQDAIENQLNFVEIDARITSDNHVVLMHDATTGRTANANLTISRAILSEIKNLRLLFGGIETQYRIPTIAEALTTAKEKIFVNIDISWGTSVGYYNKIYNDVAALNMVNQVCFYTESVEVGKGLLEMDHDVIVLQGAGNAQGLSNAQSMLPKAKLWHLATSTLNLSYTEGPFSEGVRFYANAYVNSSDSPPATGDISIVDNLIQNKVSIIQTDYPKQIKSYLQTKNIWYE